MGAAAAPGPLQRHAPRCLWSLNTIPFWPSTAPAACAASPALRWYLRIARPRCDDVACACVRVCTARPHNDATSSNIEFVKMGDVGGVAGVAPGASETTPLIPPPAGGAEASAASTPPKRENSAGHKNPFYGALRRTRRVAKALTNPWPKVRAPVAAHRARLLKPKRPRRRRFTRSSCALASAACCLATTPAT